MLEAKMNKKNRTFWIILYLVTLFSNFLMAMETGVGIDKEYLVKSDRAKLYLKVRGQDINKPVLLYLHGGPGEANGPLLFQAYPGPELEKYFVVGYLHQRHTCMSPEAPVNTLTTQQFVNDVDHIVTFLKEKFQKDKIFLIGHSFGGSLGYLYLLEHQDNIEKFVSAGGAFACVPMEEKGYQTVMALAKKTDNQGAIQQLKKIGPPPYETLQEGMTWRILGMTILEKMNESITKNLKLSKVMTITGINNFDEAWQQKSMVVAGTMWKELITIDIEDEVKHIDTPLLLIAGAQDILVPFSILKTGYKNYGGEKQYVIFKKSNHFMFIDEPDLFVAKVIEFFQIEFSKDS
jgi:pimeloyl-ACP methyl ester carboxylesterase